MKIFVYIFLISILTIVLGPIVLRLLSWLFTFLGTSFEWIANIFDWLNFGGILGGAK